MKRSSWVPAAALLVLAIACGQDDRVSDEAGDVDRVTMPGEERAAFPESANAPPSPVLDQPAAASADGGEPSAGAPAGESDYAVDLQANHPNGTVLRLTGVTLAEDHIRLDLHVTNGHRNEISLNRSGHMIVTDDTGARYNPSPPPQNPAIRVQPGTTMEGSFVFLGRLHPSATSLTLTTNSGYGGTGDYTNAPKIVIRDIPVQRQP